MTGFLVIVGVMVVAPIALFIGGAIWSAIMGDLLVQRANRNADDAHPASR
ncbi:MAG: hypothetical protein ACOYN3_04700 [Acidimicrobiia bacterium]